MKRVSINQFSAVLICFAGSLMVTPVSAQNYDAISAHGDWSVFADSGDCWVASAPIVSTNSRLSGTDSSARLHVTYRDDGRPSEVSFVGRYVFEAGQDVYAAFGPDRIDFYFEDGDGAWPEDAGADERMQAEMVRGTQVVLHVLSPDGSETVDVFSLLGFKTAAEDAASRCGQ